MQQRLDNNKGILLLWLNWVIGSGLLILLIVLSLWIRPLFLPIIAFGFQIACFAQIRRNRQKELPICYLLPFLVSRILFWTAVVMVVINTLYSRWLVNSVFNPNTINPEIPFITVLIISPIAFLISIWCYSRRATISFCRDCRMRSGSTAERGFLGMIFTREGRYQVLLITIISLAITIMAWLYYALSYVNAYLSISDKFVFIWIEVIIWLISSIYLGMRYIGIISYYCQNLEGSAGRHGRSTLMRYIIISGNHIAIKHPETNAEFIVSTIYDTPTASFLPWHESVTLDYAKHIFFNITDFEDSDLKFMYSNISGNADCNIFHYLVFLSPDETKRFNETNTNFSWMTFNSVVSLLNRNKLHPLLSAEITRLHTIAMAWKTYDSNGKRRYKIKHYKPTFRIADIRDWDVDYNDASWLYVADNNQDTPFYNFRRLWRKYINGVGNIIEEINHRKATTNNKNDSHS